MKQKLLSLIVILFFLSFVSSSPCFANTNESENLLINEDEHISMETTNIDDTVSDDSNYSGEDTSTNNTIEIDNNNVECTSPSNMGAEINPSSESNDDSVLSDDSSEAESSGKKTASVYIISYKDEDGSSWSIDGHTFLSIRNDSSQTIKVGHYNLSSGSIMTIGSWGNIPDGKVAYYNIEKYRMLKTNLSYSPNVYYKVTVTQKQLSSLTSAINNNYTWTNTKNCARFARYSWNCMFSSDSKYHIDVANVETPRKMYTKIKKMSGSKKNFSFGSKRTCSFKYVYRHTKSSKESLSTAAKKAVDPNY